jgi:hypothetical protein
MIFSSSFICKPAHIIPRNLHISTTGHKITPLNTILNTILVHVYRLYSIVVSGFHVQFVIKSIKFILL